MQPALQIRTIPRNDDTITRLRCNRHAGHSVMKANQIRQIAPSGGKATISRKEVAKVARSIKKSSKPARFTKSERSIVYKSAPKLHK